MGPIRLYMRTDSLLGLSWEDRAAHVERHLQRHLGRLQLTPVPSIPAISTAIDAYFGGALCALDTLPIDPPGTPFQRSVWKALRTIPAGKTWSYGDLARAIDHDKAFRAVARANGANPIPLVIPCHRVIAANGGLGGFSSGLDRKRYLLDHEGSWREQ